MRSLTWSWNRFLLVTWELEIKNDKIIVLDISLEIWYFPPKVVMIILSSVCIQFKSSQINFPQYNFIVKHTGFLSGRVLLLLKTWKASHPKPLLRTESIQADVQLSELKISNELPLNLITLQLMITQQVDSDCAGYLTRKISGNLKRD